MRHPHADILAMSVSSVDQVLESSQHEVASSISSSNSNSTPITLQSSLPQHDTDRTSFRTAISSLFKICISAFDRLVTACDPPKPLEKGDHSNDVLEEQAQVPAYESRKQLLDDLDNFRIWAGGCGAHRETGKESLDYRLREVLYMHDTVTGLLRELNGTLDQGTYIPWVSIYKLQYLLEDWYLLPNCPSPCGIHIELHQVVLEFLYIAMAIH